jgi:hypothetical protein
MPVAPPSRRPMMSAEHGRRRLLASLLTLALSLPSAAHSYTLDDLLRMPLERLLQLEISPRLSSQSIARALPHLGSADGSRHAA